MKAVAFAVGDEPYLLWDEEVEERTRDFLSGLDPEYFSYVIQVNTNTGNNERESVAIRLALHHAAETLFSLIGALLQAPDCPYAWIARCSTPELRQVIKRIGAGDSTLISKFKLTSVGWDSVAALVFEALDPGTDRQSRLISCFSGLWRRVAAEHLSDAVADEYNALKHGFRTRPGGFKLHWSPASTTDGRPPESEMELLGESRFGAMFYKVERLAGGGNRHLSSRRIASNWSLVRDSLLLQLLQLSIHNVVTRLKRANGVPKEECHFKVIDTEDDYLFPWKHSPSVISLTLPESTPQRLPDVSKAELLKNLREAFNGST